MGDPRLLAATLRDLSFMPFLDGEPERAEPILREGLTAAEEAGDRVLRAELWSSLGFLEVVRGNPAGAIETHRAAIEILREEGMAWKVADSLTGLGMLTRAAGDVDTARSELREALAMFAEARETLMISMVLRGLAHVANDDGLHVRAARLTGASARIRDEIGGGIPPELTGRWGDPEEDARRALGEIAYNRARAEGYAMDTDAAVAYAHDDGA